MGGQWFGRSKKKETSNLNADPHGESRQPEIASFFQMRADPAVELKRTRRQLLVSAVFIGFGGLLGAVGIYWFVTLNSARFSSQPYALFEVRALSTEGRPIAGADVKLGQISGKSDSFGEWRRYVKVKHGQTMLLQVEKRQGGENLYASRNLVVPLERHMDGSYEIKTTIELQRKVSDRRTPARAKRLASSEKKAAAPQSDLKSLRQAERSEEPRKEPSVSPRDDGFPTTSKVAPMLTGIYFDVISMNSKNSVNKINQVQAQKLRRSILPALKQKAEAMGLQVNSQAAWQIKVRHLALEKGRGLIEITSDYKGHAVKFLRNYLSEPTKTAERILAVLKYHVPQKVSVMHEGDRWYAVQPNDIAKFWQISKTDRLRSASGKVFRLSPAEPIGPFSRLEIVDAVKPCQMSQPTCSLNTESFQNTPPRLDWQPVRLRLLNGGSGLDIYVAGFAAVPTSERTWQYWGKPGTGANLTIVRDGQIVHRDKIYSLKDRPISVAIQRGTVARR